MNTPEEIEERAALQRRQPTRDVAMPILLGKLWLYVVVFVLIVSWFTGWYGFGDLTTYAERNESSAQVDKRNIYSVSGSRTENGLRFTLREAELGDREHLPDPRSGAEFVGYRMTVTNVSNEPTTYRAWYQKLVVNGSEYATADVGFYEANGSEELNPGLSANVYLVFEIPENIDMSDARLLFEGSSYAVFAGF